MTLTEKEMKQMFELISKANEKDFVLMQKMLEVEITKRKIRLITS